MTTDLSPADLQAIRARLESAIAGYADTTSPMTEFYHQAPVDLAALLALVDRQAAEIERLRKEIDRLVPIAAVHGL